jgi:hypothetical protein
MVYGIEKNLRKYVFNVQKHLFPFHRAGASPFVQHRNVSYINFPMTCPYKIPWAKVYFGCKGYLPIHLKQSKQLSNSEN